MSKMVKALNKVNELRDSGYAEPLGNDGAFEAAAEKQEGVFSKKETKFIGMFAMLVIISISSIIINFKTLSELRTSKGVAGSLVKNVDQQQGQIANLELMMADRDAINIQQLDGFRSQIVGFEAKLSDAGENIDQAEAEVEELAVDYGILKVLVDDLKLSDRLLLDKYISLNSSIKKIEERKEKFENQSQSIADSLSKNLKF